MSWINRLLNTDSTEHSTSPATDTGMLHVLAARRSPQALRHQMARPLDPVVAEGFWDPGLISAAHRQWQGHDRPAGALAVRSSGPTGSAGKKAPR